MHHFQDTFSPAPDTTILDVGGTPYNWTFIQCESRITLLNLTIQTSLLGNMEYAQGDGAALPYADGQFDICYSNSVIEHLGTFENQQKFAREICRVAKKVWVQTPAKSFFIEPHLLTPFIHCLPKKLQKKLIRNFSLWGWITRPDQNDVNKFISEVRLLNFDEMKKLFPGCTIHREKFLGLTKAYIAIRK